MTLPSLRPGRLCITCVDAQHVRSRVGNDSDENSLSPYILFELKSGDSVKSNRGKNKGHDVDFESSVVSFDLADPEQNLEGNDVLLSVQLQDESEGVGLIGEAELVMNEILTSANTEFVKELEVLRPGDSTTNTVVKLKFLFIPTKIGMLKLYLHHLVLSGVEESLVVTARTQDGQKKQSTLKDVAENDSIDFWIDKKNCFGHLTIQFHREGEDEKSSIQLEPLSLIDFGARDRGKVSTGVSVRSWSILSTSMMEVTSIDLYHEFMEAGFVHLESIELNIPSDAASDISNNMRVVVKSKGKAHRNEQMTASGNISNSKLIWNKSPVSIPVVDEYTLLVECCEYDEIACDRDEIGIAEISLLPLFRDGEIETTVNLKHATELGDELDAGILRVVATFDPPKDLAFPQDQATMTSYIYVRPNDKEEEKAVQPDDFDADGCVFTEEDIKKAFNLFDLDKNGYIGAAELRHCLIFMGEHVTEQEVDMMISMLDKNGDGQVSYREFKAMAEADDPSSEDFLTQQYNKQALESPSLSVEAKQRNDLTVTKMEVFHRCVRTCNIDTFAVARMWDILRAKAYADPSAVNSSSFHVEYDGFCELMPVFSTTSESHLIYDLIRNGASYVDGRELIMSFSNFVGFSNEDKCRLAFDMYDDDRSGYLSLDEIEAMMMSTHLKSRDVIKKRAFTLMKSADTDNSGGITINELIVSAERFPNLLFPSHSKKHT